MEELGYRTSQLSSRRAFGGYNREAPIDTKVPMYQARVLAATEDEEADGYTFKVVSKMVKLAPTTVEWVNAKLAELEVHVDADEDLESESIEEDEEES